MILASLLRGRRRAHAPDFDEVMAEHGPSLRRLAATYAPPGATREDLEQEITIAVWEALENFRGESSLRTYLFRVAHNCCIDLLRKGRLELVEDPRDVVHAAPSPERLTAARQDLERVAAALRTIPVAQRQSLFMVLEGLTHAQIAEAMGVSESAISVRIHRARQALSEVLDPEDADG